jgi:hypothetical protein
LIKELQNDKEVVLGAIKKDGDDLNMPVKNSKRQGSGVGAVKKGSYSLYFTSQE